MIDPEAERLRMVERQIRRRGVSRTEVLAAMEKVPRHEFVPEDYRKEAYEDHPIPIDEDQTISQPYMVAMMTELLALGGGERVLEIGTGSGYQTAVLAECAATVYTVERRPRLAARARTTLTMLGYENIAYLVGDGSLGWPQEAPFGGIIVTAAAPSVPESLLAQLDDPGILVIPIGGRLTQDLVTIHRAGGRDRRVEHLRCAFVPLVGEEGYPSA